jgi:hypothetical protein
MRQFRAASGDRQDPPVKVASGIWRWGAVEQERDAGRKTECGRCGGTECFR